MSAGNSNNRLRMARLFNVLGPFLGLALVISIFALNPSVRPYFLTGPNFKIIFSQTVIVAIGALGMTMIIVSGGIDLSVGSVVALAGVLGATALLRHHSQTVAVIVTIVSGAAVGFLNGAMIAGFRMMPFIVTLGMMGVGRGVAKWVAGNQTVNFPESSITRVMDSGDPNTFFPLPPGVWIAAGPGSPL